MGGLHVGANCELASGFVVGAETDLLYYALKGDEHAGRFRGRRLWHGSRG